MLKAMIGFVLGVLVSTAGAQLLPSVNSAMTGCVDGSLVAYSATNGLGCAKSTVIGSLPTCNSGSKGTRMVVTDALTPVALATAVAGGAVVIPVFCNGTVWTVG